MIFHLLICQKKTNAVVFFRLLIVAQREKNMNTTCFYNSIKRNNAQIVLCLRLETTNLIVISSDYVRLIVHFRLTDDRRRRNKQVFNRSLLLYYSIRSGKKQREEYPWRMLFQSKTHSIDTQVIKVEKKRLMMMMMMNLFGKVN